MKVYIGFDEREEIAARVAAFTLGEVTNGEVQAEFLSAAKLNAHGLLYRITDQRGGQDYDLVSNAPKSTRFAVSRFLTPVLCQSDLALFVDCDVVFLQDPRRLVEWIAGSSAAVYVVKHVHAPWRELKMVNQRQTAYPRKNWSSVALFNCTHPANQRLTIADINTRPGRDLHRFYWLNDSEIGELPSAWNWLVGEQERPAAGPCIAHFTNGGPWLDGWKSEPYDEIWLAACKRMLADPTSQAKLETRS